MIVLSIHEKSFDNILTFCGIRCKIELTKFQRIALLLAKVKNFAVYLFYLIDAIVYQIIEGGNVFEFLSFLCYNTLAIIGYSYYLIYEDEITQLLSDCEVYAHNYSEELSRKGKFVSYVITLIFVIEMLVLNFGLDEEPLDILFNSMWVLFFDTWLLGIGMLYEKCGHCIQLGDRSLFTQTTPTADGDNNYGPDVQPLSMNPINYTNLHQRLKQSREKKERINGYCGTFPFFWIVMNVIAVIRATILTFVNKETTSFFFVAKFELIVLLSLVLMTLALRFTYFDLRRPNIEYFDDLILDRPPPQINEEIEAKKRIKRDLTVNDKCLYKILFMYNFDVTLLNGLLGLIFTIVFGFIPNLASENRCIEHWVGNYTNSTL